MFFPKCGGRDKTHYKQAKQLIFDCIGVHSVISHISLGFTEAHMHLIPGGHAVIRDEMKDIFQCLFSMVTVISVQSSYEFGLKQIFMPR